MGVVVLMMMMMMMMKTRVQRAVKG